MANRLFYNPEGYVEILIIGDQTSLTFMDLKADAESILEKLQNKGKQRLILIDISQQGEFSTDSNKAGLEVLESTSYDSVAIFGATSRALKEVAEAIILAMGKDNAKLFSDRQTALAWLLGPKT